MSPQQTPVAIPTKSQTRTTLTKAEVVANLQLMLALRRSQRNAQLMCWLEAPRAA